MTQLRVAMAVGATTIFVAGTAMGGPAAVRLPTQAAGSLTASRFGRGFAETRPGSIVLARADGSGSRILTRGWLSYVSPAGSRVAVIDSDVVRRQPTNWRLELYTSAGGRPTHVIRVQCGKVSWSPDSRKLACVTSGTSGQLLVFDAVTGAATRLVTGVIDPHLSFSPDSTKVAYVEYGTATWYSDTGRLRVVDLASRAITTVRDGGAAAPVWGPTAIAFSLVTPRGRQYTYNVAVVQPDGSGFRRLTQFRPSREQSGLIPVAWSADGRRLLAGVFGDDWTAFIAYAIDPNRGGARLITRRVTPTALSKDGHHVIGQTGSAATTTLFGSTVVRVPWAGGRQRLLLRSAVYPSFTG